MDTLLQTQTKKDASAIAASPEPKHDRCMGKLERRAFTHGLFVRPIYSGFMAFKPPEVSDRMSFQAFGSSDSSGITAWPGAGQVFSVGHLDR
jgi:hypothetical protein